MAGVVDPSAVTTFENGEPTDADEMNSPLQALITAIDDNASRIAALEASQATQYGGLANHSARIATRAPSQVTTAPGPDP